MIRRCLLRLILLVAMAIGAHGQAELDNTQPKLPARPTRGVMDESHYFNRDPEALQEIESQIRKLAETHGYYIYLVVEPVLIGATGDELAADYRQAWLPGGDGMVLVFEVDTRKLAIGQDIAGNATDSDNPARVPSFETQEILNHVLNSVDQKLAPDVYVKTLVDQLTTEFSSYFDRRNTPPPVSRSVKTIAAIIGTLALMGLGAIGIGSMIRHARISRPRTFQFPKVDRPERLAAPCGASVTVRKFEMKGRA